MDFQLFKYRYWQYLNDLPQIVGEKNYLKVFLQENCKINLKKMQLILQKTIGRKYAK